MIEQILMGASAVITLSACYCGFYYARQAQDMAERHETMRQFANHTMHRIRDLDGEIDRMAEVIGSHQSKAHKCDKCNQFASKRAAKTSELREYVASKKVA